MDREERLAHTLWWIVMLMALAFFCFAAAVFMLEDREPSVVTVVYEPAEISAPKLEMPAPATESAAVGLDPMVEGTYLRADHPLSYEEQAALYGACLEFGVDYALAQAVIEQETGFRNVVGDSGASVGFMQIQKRWWSELMAEIGAEDLTDPKDNFRTGCAILRQLLDKYESTEDALTAYNSGQPGSSKYSRAVLERVAKYA